MHTKDPTHRPTGEMKRRTSITLTNDQWAALQAIEYATGAKPSVIIRRALDLALRDRGATHEARSSN